jgi:hypothetical protein
MARRRTGLAAARRLAAAPSLEAARDQLAGTAYADVVTAPPGLAATQRAVADATLWQIRVLAGWLPAGGTVLARAVVAAFERENLMGHLGLLAGGTAPPPFDLGTLATAWNRVRPTTTTDAALMEISASPWGKLEPGDLSAVRDQLTAAWLRRLILVAPSARPWARTAAVLLVARSQVVEGRRLPEPAAAQLTGLLGSRYASARTIDDLRETLVPTARRVLDAVASPEQLWRADASLWTSLADGGARLLRGPLAGPDHVVGAVAVLAADAFRVRAALAAAAAGTHAEIGEVLGGAA